VSVQLVDDYVASVGIILSVVAVAVLLQSILPIDTKVPIVYSFHAYGSDFLTILKTGLNAFFYFWHCETNYKTATNT